MTNDDERAAREWLLSADGSAAYRDEDDARHRATILRLLDRPVLPRGKDVPDEVLGRMANAIFGRAHLNNGEAMRAAIDVLHAHLTAPPKPKRYELLAFFRQDDTHPFCTGHDIKYMNNMLDRWPGGRVVKLVEAADE